MALRAPIFALLAPITVDRSIAVATPRGHVGPEGRAAAGSDVASRRLWRPGGRWCWSWPHARAARSSATGIPIAMALRAPIFALLAPVTVDRSIASAAPRGHIGAEGRATALRYVASRVALR